MINQLDSWAWHHSGFAVASLPGALKFYRYALGFEPVFEAIDMSDLIESVTGISGLRADLVQCRSPFSSEILELIEFRNVPASYSGPAPVQPGRAHSAFLVTDLQRAVETVEQLGGGLIGQITVFSEGRAAYLTDGAGNAIELEEAVRE